MNEKFGKLEGRPSIDTFLARQRHMIHQASVMADQKASICLALQLGLLTLIAHQFTGTGPETAPVLGRVWWLVPLALSNLAAVVLCTYVLMPSLGPRNRLNGPARSATAVNPLFFKQIAQRSEEDFLDEMGSILQADHRIYEAISIDMHRESLVLHRKKYRFLELAYGCFLGGILLTALCFVIKLVAAPTLP